MPKSHRVTLKGGTVTISSGRVVVRSNTYEKALDAAEKKLDNFVSVIRQKARDEKSGGKAA